MGKKSELCMRVTKVGKESELHEDNQNGQETRALHKGDTILNMIYEAFVMNISFCYLWAFLKGDKHNNIVVTLKASYSNGFE